MFLKPPARQMTVLLNCEIFHRPSICIKVTSMTPPATKKLSTLFAFVLLPSHMCMATRLARTVAVPPSMEISGAVKRCCELSKRVKLCA